ncbi:hypothetical protein [Allomuricauda sp. F6463D]|uniref:hypothetical protein n=1 Tax=Allomuricauda sp. F6463D TaxID=2926409 RepID=UPI001FF6B289|nr:hypothetical protein [Muricauda sp. F6463D]MCK0162072.1 hypothetical protein [Muricauda sp. F6463D]
MVYSLKLAQQVYHSTDFKKTLFANYMTNSNGIDMQKYARLEKRLLCMGVYGVEDYHRKVTAYIRFLEEVIE